MSITQLSDYNILPCVDCGTCGKNLPCPFLKRDDSQPFMQALLQAPILAFTAPIYFYHLPAQLKALIDRCQQYYAWRENSFFALESLPRRKAFVILLGARKQGEQLFKGALLSLKFALAPFNIELAEPLTLHGLDKPADLSGHAAHQNKIRNYGKEAALFLQQSSREL